MVRALRLTDGVVELRPPRRTDTSELYFAIRESMDLLLPWMAWAHPEYNEVDAAEWVRRAARAFSDGQEFQFVMREVATGALLGCVGLNGIDRLNRWGNLGYWIRTSQQGNGFVTKAAKLVSSWGLTELNLNRIEILAAVDNSKSQSVAERAGAVREGVLRRRLRVGDVVQDAAVFSIV